MLQLKSNKTTSVLLIMLVAVLFVSCTSAGSSGDSDSEQQIKQLESIDGREPMNVVFILSDDHRYDFMGFTGKVPYLQTPNMDFMANNGAWLKNAFVTTSLCSITSNSII